jgi:hypothetical protein
LRRFILACGLVLAFAGLTTAAAAAVGSKRATAGGTNPATTTTTTTTQASMTARRPGKHAITYWMRHIRVSRAGTQRWLAVINGRPGRGGSARRLSARSFARLPGLARRWRHREHAAWWRANHPPELQGWTCIHRYEGSWRDSSGPYYGGLQMDLSFQATYGSWLLHHRGTADHWSPLEQIWTAVRAWRVRGFSPWPSTAHYCGMA